MKKKTPFASLLHTNCKLEAIQSTLFPEISKISLYSDAVQIITDFHNKYFLTEYINKRNQTQLNISVIFFKGNADNLDPSYDYVMLGNVYEINRDESIPKIKVSFGGLLMEISANVDVIDMDEVGLGMKICI